MPAPRNITPEEKERFKVFIEKFYDIEIVDANDCLTLSKIIYDRKRISVSPTTLRRFFNLMSYQKEHSRYTLNQLAKAVDFESFDSFINNNASIGDLKSHILLYDSGSDIFRKVIQDTLKSIIISNSSVSYQLKNLLHVIVAKEDWSLLTEFIYTHFSVKGPESEKFLPDIYQFFFAETKNNIELLKFVENHIAESVNLQNHLLLSHVNEFVLEEHYIKWINNIEQPVHPHLFLHKIFLNLQFSYTQQRETETRQFYILLTDTFHKNPGSFNICSLAKLCSWSLIFEDFHNFVSNDFIKNLADSDLVEFVISLSNLTWFNKEAVALVFFASERIKKLERNDSVLTNVQRNLLRLAMSLNCYFSGDSALSANLLQKTDLKLLDFNAGTISLFNKWYHVIDKTVKGDPLVAGFGHV